MNLPDQINGELRNGAALLISISGGKDSDAMVYRLMDAYEENHWTGPIELIHADLGRMEWKMTPGYVRTLAKDAGLPLHVVGHPKGDIVDGIWRRMERRPDAPPFPSSAARWCTSDYKRATIDKWIRNTYPADATVYCAIGVRAAESSFRAKKPTLIGRRGCMAPTKNRYAFNWLPIHDFSLADVWSTIGYSLDELHAIQRQVKQAADPLGLIQEIQFKAHPAYALGNERLSCALCVMASPNDLRNGSAYNPELANELIRIEDASGFTFRQNMSLREFQTEKYQPQQLQLL